MIEMNAADRYAIFRYTEEKYGSKPQYLWMKYPRYAVLRHGENGKWYALVMEVEKSKLGLKGDGGLDILDVKSDPALIALLKQTEGFLPAYHMSHEHWITVLLNGSVPAEQIFELLDLSYELTKPQS